MTRPFRQATTGGGGPATYIEDVFSTYLYTGNSSGQTITNGIDLSTKGGMVWLKSRSSSTDHNLYYTDAGVRKYLKTNTVDAQATWGSGYGLTAFNADGFTIGNDTSVENTSNVKYTSWTFRKQAKFFDVVQWTGDGTNNRQISHALGSTPGCIIVKELNQTGSWFVYHTSNGTGKYIRLNSTDAVTTSSAYFPAVSSTTFTPTSDTQLNTSTVTYVAYLFAHNAGGFGATGNDNVITCGFYTGNGSTSGPSINLGWEPQWLMIKRTDYTSSTTGWYMSDTFRGMPATTGVSGLYTNYLIANHQTSENNYNFAQQYVSPTATGFTLTSSQSDVNASGGTYIYIAIRRGPMKTPTTGASVFEPAFATANSPEYKSNTVISGFDTALTIYRPGYSDANFSFPYTAARLTGARQILQTSQTNAEYTYSTAANFAYNTGWFDSVFGNDTNRESYMFKRAPSFHDVVCYTGTGSQLNVSHNLGAVPELMIVRVRNKTTPENWCVYSQALGAGYYLALNSSAAKNSSFDSTRFPVAPTSSVFTVGSDQDNGGAFNYVAYLFASCPGVSKVGSYTGTGTTLQINCGFTGGARFVLIKRTDSTGDWYVWDTARGIISGNDPYILLNSTAAEVTSTDYIDPYSAGFEISSTAPAAINASGGTFIYLAIS